MRFKLAMLAVIGFSLSACASGSIYDDRLESKKHEYMSQMYEIHCEDKRVPEQQCGLIFESPKAEAQMFKDYAASTCPKARAESEEQGRCFQGFRDQYMAKMALRYPRADWNHLALECKATPSDCTWLSMVELRVMSSHNQRLFQAYSLEKDGIQLQAEADQQRRSQIMSHAFDGMTKPTVTCTTLGNQTTCH